MYLKRIKTFYENILYKKNTRQYFLVFSEISPLTLLKQGQMSGASQGKMIQYVLQIQRIHFKKKVI